MLVLVLFELYVLASALLFMLRCYDGGRVGSCDLISPPLLENSLWPPYGGDLTVTEMPYIPC